MSATNVLITGLGRSGTTLTCHLLDKVPDTVSLFEPMKVKTFAELPDHAAVADAVQQFCDEQRESIHERKRAITKNAGGVVPDNPYGAEKNEGGTRQRLVRKGEIQVDRELSPEFTLVIKHVSAFAAVIDELVKRFPVYAIVRNPLATLASWSTIDFPAARGHAPGAERLDAELRTRLESIEDTLDRQIALLAWFHGRFQQHLPDESIIRYEELVESHGRALSVVHPGAASLDEPLENRNINALYDREEMERIAERLLRSEGAHWETYGKDSVESLLEAPAARPG